MSASVPSPSSSNKPTEMASFTSYAQNFEDVMLWRALKHVERGCYIDIGAQHPVIDSVSKGFYEQGWRGVHIEPVRHYADLLRADRPDETVLEIAISDVEGILELQVIPDTGLSTGVKQYADTHRREFGFEYQSVAVPMLSIRAALAAWEGQSIHWMKIDIEGLEESALRGWDSARLRPWIVVVEATVPSSQLNIAFDMDGMLSRAGYELAYFDGLNRFYVADEHGGLKSSLRLPPNVFDGVSLSGTATSAWCNTVNEQRSTALSEREALAADFRVRLLNSEREHKIEIARVQSALENAQSALGSTRAEILRLHTEAARALAVETAIVASMTRRAELAEHEVHAVRSSTSWRVTRPLRLLASLSRGQLAPHQVARLAGWARRLKVFGPARYLYRRFMKGAAQPANNLPDVNRTRLPLQPKPCLQGIASSRCENIHMALLTDDARQLLLQIRPTGLSKGEAT